MFAEEACNPTTKEYSTKTYYYCNSNSNNRYFSQSDATSACTTTGTVNSKTDYYCSLNPSTIYTSQSVAQSNCVKTETGNTSSKTTYTCSITNTIYNNQSDAVSACTNYCENGDYYDNKCYYLR